MVSCMGVFYVGYGHALGGKGGWVCLRCIYVAKVEALIAAFLIDPFMWLGMCNSEFSVFEDISSKNRFSPGYEDIIMSNCVI